MSEKLSDNEIDDRLHAALELIGEAQGQTTRGSTTLDAARQSLALLKFGLLYAAFKNSDKNDAISEPPSP